jgi:hypothetical protein
MFSAVPAEKCVPVDRNLAASYSLYLLKAVGNIIFYGCRRPLLPGNEDFSDTLNRRKEEHPSIDK